MITIIQNPTRTVSLCYVLGRVGCSLYIYLSNISYWRYLACGLHVMPGLRECFSISSVLPTPVFITSRLNRHQADHQPAAWQQSDLWKAAGGKGQSSLAGSFSSRDVFCCLWRPKMEVNVSQAPRPSTTYYSPLLLRLKQVK